VFFQDNSLYESANMSPPLEEEQVSPTSEIEDNSVLLARLAGRQDVTMQFRHESLAGPKVELILKLGALTVFASPHQVHKLIEFIQSMSTSHGPDTRYVCTSVW